MRILVAGASSVLGLPVLRELGRRGHEVHGLTRSPGRAATIVANRADAVIGDVHDGAAIRAVVDEVRPDAVVSLLIALPRYGPRTLRDFRETVALWRRGVPNLLDAAAAAGVERVVAESVVYAYGYGDHGEEPLHESAAPRPEPALPGGRSILEALHEMERRVLTDARFSGSVLRYGAFHGPAVPSTRLLTDLLRWRIPVVLGRGQGITSWIEISDAARATADAVVDARPGVVYNVVDDRPIAFADYAAIHADVLGLPPPRRLPRWIARLVAPYTTAILDRTRLPVSNRRAKRELGWSPRFPTVHDTARLVAQDLGRLRSNGGWNGMRELRNDASS